MQTDTYRDIIERYIRAYNAFDVEDMLRDLHPEIQFMNISNGKVNLETSGIEEFKAQAIQAKEYFAERNQKIVDIRFSEDKVEVDIDYSAILAMDFPNGMRAGDKLKMKGRSVFGFRDNKIASLSDIS